MTSSDIVKDCTPVDQGANIGTQNSLPTYAFQVYSQFIRNRVLISFVEFGQSFHRFLLFFCSSSVVPFWALLMVKELLWTSLFKKSKTLIMDSYGI